MVFLYLLVGNWLLRVFKQQFWTLLVIHLGQRMVILMLFLCLHFFSFLLVCNLFGLVPYSFTATSHLAVTVTLGLVVWVGKLIIGIRAHGIKLAGIFLPQGLPLVIVPALVAIEILSFFMVLISLPVRLFANIISGHILLKVLAGFAWSIMASGGLLFIAHFAPLTVLFGLIFLETGVAMVQA